MLEGKILWNRRTGAAELDISYKALLCKIKQRGLSLAPGHSGINSEDPS